VISLGTLQPQEQKQASWVVRGDVAGKYRLTGVATGDLVLGGSRVPLESSLVSDEFEVVQPKLDVLFTMPTTVYQGQEFSLRLDITNKSSIVLQGVNVNIKADKLVNCHMALDENPSKAVGEIGVGAMKSIAFRFVSHVTGYVNLAESYVTTDPNISPSLTVVATQPNQSPIAVNDTATTAPATTVWVNVLGNDSDPDGDPLAVSAITQPGHGLTEIDLSTGKVKYTPVSGYLGNDQFTYTISDGYGGFATANASVSV
jgi:hypothetical protein